MRSEALAAQHPAHHRPLEPGGPPSPTQDPVAECQRLPPPLPPRLDWFIHTQAGVLAQGNIPTWFHGAISRQDAEDLLETQPPGAFLVRVSHSHVGYTLSYRALGCCRHFMVKLLDTGNFQVPGEPRTHPSLDALVAFHQQQPLRPHQQLLTQPCGQKDPENVDYEDLFQYQYTVSELAHSSSPILAPCPSVPPTQAAWRLELGPPRPPLQEAGLRLWRRLKTLPEAGRKVPRQLRSHLAAVAAGAREAARGPGSQDKDPTPPSEAWAPRDAGVPPEDAHGAPTPQECPPDAQKAPLPEEYRPPPPFAPGYC